MHQHTPVVVLGGGPVGLTASIMLSRAGIAHVLLERHDGTSIHPKAIGLNQRTIETFRELGLEERIAAAAAPAETVGRTSWYTSFRGPTELHGRRLAIRDAWGGGAYAEEYAAISPSRYTMLPQIRLEPILRDEAASAPTAELRFGHEAIAVSETAPGSGVRVAVRDRAAGTEYELTAEYAIVADGGRGIGGMLGIADEGPRDLLDMVSVHFSADLGELVGDPGSLITWFINPDFGGSIGSGYLYHIGPWDSDRSREWVFACAFTAEDPERFDEAAMIRRIARSFGTDEFDAEIHSISHWYIQAVVAERFRAGGAFLVGDAAHRIPPWGALGLNTGIGDVRNLVWKLAVALRSPEHAEILDSYESERRPVAQAVAERSLANFQAHGGIVDRALGLDPSLPPADNWARLAELWQEDPSGDARREALDRAMRTLDEEFHAHGTECGFHYERGALLPEEETEASSSFGALVYRPLGAPGHHLPHAWLHDDDGPLSTIDLPVSDRWLLLVDRGDDAGAAAWSAAVAGLPEGLRDLVTIRTINGASDPRIDGAEWHRASGIHSGGALLVRPDRIVSWRAADAAAAAELETALRRLVGVEVAA